MQNWTKLSSRYLIRDRWMRLRADSCTTAAGVLVEPYYVQEPDDWVHVVGFNAQDEVLMVRQYRHGAEKISCEIPGGVIEPGEDPAVAAGRELLEETGYRAGRLEKLASHSPNPASHANRVHNFIAFDLERCAEPAFDEFESIETFWRPWRAVLDDIAAGEVFAGLHAASILMAFARRGLLKPA